MNLSTFRSMLRRRVHAPNPLQPTDAELDVILNEAAKQIQLRYSKIDRQSAIEIYTFSISYAQQLLNSGFYPLPEGTWQVLGLARLDSSSGKYLPVPKRDYEKLADLLSGGSGTYPEGLLYARYGRFLYFAPLLAPTSAATSLRLIVVGTVTMTDPTDVPNLPLALHYPILLQAQIMYYGESHNDSKPVMDELERVMAHAENLADDSAVEINPQVFKQDYRARR